jgi:transcriptional regulator with XRE-family HTH domain
MGARIATLSRKAGLSQAQLAEAFRIPQRTVSFYEREAGDIPAGLEPPMARALGVSVDELLGETEKKRRAGAGAGPTDRMRRLFEAASKLPRSQQERIAALIQTFVNQHSDREVCAEGPRVISGTWRAPHAKQRDTSPPPGHICCLRS